MTQEVQQFFEKAKSDTAKMKELAPDTVNGFAALFTKVMRDGAISLLEKELIAVGISVALCCTPCIRAHVRRCLRAGATKEQILEAASVAVVMGGGPASMYVPDVIDTLEALES